MAFYKKNIWTLFYLLIFVGALFLGIILFNKYRDLHRGFKVQNRHIVEVVSNSVHSYLMQNELALDVVGKQLARDMSYSNYKESEKVLNDLLKTNKTVAGFGFFTPDGTARVTTSNVDINKIPNLKTFQQSSTSFQKAIDSKSMILGRTYFNHGLDTWVIPLRKSIKDDSGNTVAVMTTGLKVSSSNGIFNKNILLDNSHSISIFRNSDHRVQFQLAKESIDPKKYTTPFSKEFTSSLIKTIELQTGKTIQEIMHNEEIITFQNRKFFEDAIVLTIAKFDKTYNIWIASQISLDSLYSKFITFALISLVIFILITLTLFYFVREIANYEEIKREILQKQAMRDFLTELPNRLFLTKEVNSWIEKDEEFFLVFIDMDNFKYVNDNYGHNYGDLVLIEIAKRLKQLLGRESFVVRHGGDEFIILLKKQNSSALKTLLESLKEKLIKTYEIDGNKFVLGASIGVSQYPDNGDNLNSLLRCADIAMYEAKKEKNRYFIFNTELEKSYEKSAVIEKELKFALEKNEFYLVYQPQFIAAKQIYGVETLLRWKNEKLGEVSPARFIHLAENSGLMPNIGKFVIENSFKELGDFIKDKRVQLSLNISLKQFMEKNFFEDLLERIERHNIDKNLLTLEITENIFIEDIDYIIDLLKRIKKEGINISLDDFGTGYSSLSLLKKLPIDELKIDKSFVDDIVNDTYSMQMVKSIITICKDLGFNSIAEGIESSEQTRILRLLGCQVFQGYKYSKPISANALIKEEYV